ncbi:RNA-binding domain-containing protein [Peniophora sp. CONT]|nr:RNA-binding domain-containing protein [Peniophora sp. CONT]
MSHCPSLVSAAVSPIRRVVIAHAGFHSRQAVAGTSYSSRIEAHLASTSRSFSIRPHAHALRHSRTTFSTRASNVSYTPMRRSLTVLVRHLSASVDDEELAAAFAECGRIVIAHVRDRQINGVDSLGWSGYVRFAAQESVDKALALNGKSALGTAVSIHPQFELADTINVGRLPLGVSDEQVKALFSSCGEVLDVKIHTSLAGQGARRSYGFVRFASPSSVDAALFKRFQLNGRSLHVVRAAQRAEEGTIWDDYSDDAETITRMLHVNNLPPQVNDEQLKAEFELYGAVAEARVMRTFTTGTSLGFGYIIYASPTSINIALQVKSKEIAGHPLQISRAPPLRPSALEYSVWRPQGDRRYSEPEQTKTVFVGRLTYNVDGAWLQREFAQFGDVVGVRVSRDRATGKSKGFAHVEFKSPSSVDKAVEHHNRLTIDGFTVQISRSYQNKNRREVRNNVDTDPESYDPYDQRNSSDSWEYNY